jgi:hypothetical protein
MTDRNFALIAFVKSELGYAPIEPNTLSELLEKYQITEEEQRNFTETNSHVTEKQIINDEKLQLSIERKRSASIQYEEEKEIHNKQMVVRNEVTGKIDGHNKAVIKNVVNNMSEIHAEHRQERQQMRSDAINRSRNNRN